MKEQCEDLMCAYRKESDPKAGERMLAVSNVVKRDETIPTIAKLFRKAYNSIRNQVARFKQFGISCLYGKPRSRRPSKITDHKITEFLQVLKTEFFQGRLYIR